MQAPLPENETARVQALRDYQILDTPAEAEFDDFTLLAAHICGTPIALISLVDSDRQWFKSKIGLDADETPREQAFCAHALHGEGIFMVPDASRDARFFDNPLVTEDPNVRFYAGAPLVTEGGQALGTLCVIDRVPRTLTAEQERALQALSRQVIARLELRRQMVERDKAERELRASEARKGAIFQSALDCIITMDGTGRVVEWNPAAEWTFGYVAEEAVGRELAMLIVPPGLRDAHRQGLSQYLTTGEGPVLGKRIEITAMRAGGDEFPIELAITPIPLQGETLFTAYLRDISERKQSEEALRRAHDEMEVRVEERTRALNQAVRQNQTLLECAGEGIFGVDLSGCTTFANPAAARMVGWSQEELIGKASHSLMHHTRPDGAPFPQHECPIYASLHDGTAHQVEDELFWRRDGSGFPVQYISTPLWEEGRLTGAVVTFQDITERKRAEQQLQSSKDMLQLVMDNIPQLIFWKDRHSVYQGCNRNFAQAAGLADANAVTGLTDYDLPWTRENSDGYRRDDRRIMDCDRPELLFLETQRQADGSDRWVETNKVPLHDSQGHVVGILGTYADITERKCSEEQIRDLNAELTQAYDATIEGWSRALDLRDQETEGHSRRVTALTLRLAHALGIGEDEMVHVRRGALLHDIGKMGVPDRVLLKPGPLSDDEWVVMRRHPDLAREMLWPVHFLRPALDIPHCHHEKWDGSGYPRGLCGEDIPLSARLFAIVDVWDALRSNRPYRAAWPVARVLDHVRGLSGTHFDPQVVRLFLAMMEETEPLETRQELLAA